MKIGTTNIIDITNNNSLDITISPVSAIIDCSATGSCKRVESPCKPLNIRAAHNAERIILTSIRLLAVFLFESLGGLIPRSLLRYVFWFALAYE